MVKDIPHDSDWGGVNLLLHYFYDNRGFYRKALKVEGQNSFSEHLSDICYPVLSERLQVIMNTDEVSEFQVGFFADGIICGIKRWLTSPECLPPDVFIEQIKSCVYMAARHICYDLDGAPRDNKI